MPYLKLHRDETDTEIAPPQPLPFRSLERNWRSAGQDTPDHGEEQMDSIAQVESALHRVENTFESLSEQVEELSSPILMSDWLDHNDDEGPFAA